jgi:hypothetical protein
MNCKELKYKYSSRIYLRELIIFLDYSISGKTHGILSETEGFLNVDREGCVNGMES